MKSLIYLIIGLPFIVGLVVRAFFHDEDFMLQSISITSAVYMAVGVGYFFDNIGGESGFFYQYSSLIITFSVLISFIYLEFSISYEDLSRSDQINQREKGCATAIILSVLTFMFTNVAYFVGLGKIVTFVGTILSFGISGMIQAVLGTIVSGFNVSSMLYSLIDNGSLENIYLWSGIFSFLGISRSPARIFIVVLTAVLGTYEFFGDQILGSKPPEFDI